MEKFNSNKDEYTNQKPVSEAKKNNSIDLRPDNINNRERFGDWELDTVVSKAKGQNQCLMTLTDRKIRFEIIARLEGKTKDEVINKMEKIESLIKNNLNDIIKSISTDNGSEFSGWKEIQEILETTVYFCHPYRSGEKGTNEKHNGIIRYFIPKGDLIENYSNKDIEDIANWMNNYPRKIFGYKTPIEMLKEEIKNDDLFNTIINIQKKLNAI
jgi:IS30 family transposase